MENIDLYKLRQKYTDLSNIVFLKLMDEYKQVINVVEDVYSINGLKKSFECLDNFVNSTDYIIDENYLRHLCISAIIENNTFLKCLAKKLNIFVDYNTKISDSIDELEDKAQKRNIINQSNNLQIIKETLPLILFIGIYKLKNNFLELMNFRRVSQVKNEVFKFKPSKQYLNSIKNDQHLSVSESILLSNVEPINKSGTEIVIPLGIDTFCILLVEGLFDICPSLMDKLTLTIKKILNSDYNSNNKN